MNPIVEAAKRDTGQLDAGKVARQSLNCTPCRQAHAREAAPDPSRRARAHSVVQSHHPPIPDQSVVVAGVARGARR
jgi:hypothetical protein